MLSEEVKKWGMEHYPDYINNEKLIQMLYDKAMGRGQQATYGGYEKKKVNELKEGDWVELRGIVIKYTRTFSHEGCVKCFRKSCSCNAGKATICRNAYIFGDDTDIIKVVMPMKIGDTKEFNGGEEAILYGRVNKWNNSFEVNVKKYEIISVKQIHQEISEILEMLRTVKEMEKNSFINYISRKYGKEYADVKDYVEEIKHGNDVWVKVKE